MAQERSTGPAIHRAALRWTFRRDGSAGVDPRGEWAVDVEVAEVAGKFEVVGFNFRSHDENGQPLKGRSLRTIGANQLRRLSLPDLRREAIAAIGGDLPDRESRDLAYRSLKGRTSTDEDHYLEVAQVYADAWRRGDSPRTAVAAHFEAKGVSAKPRTVARWVERCRSEYGYLAKTEPRRADGHLTTRAQRLLHERKLEAEGI